MRLINSSASKENEAEASELERYTSKPPAIKVSLGLVCLYILILSSPILLSFLLFSSSSLLSCLAKGSGFAIRMGWVYIKAVQFY